MKKYEDCLLKRIYLKLISYCIIYSVYGIYSIQHTILSIIRMHMAIDRFIIKDKRIVYSFILKILRGFVTFAELKLVSKVEKEKKRMRFQKLG